MADNEDKFQEENAEKRWWSEAMREVALTGLATFFMTEDSIRSRLKEMKLPKELMSLVLEGASKKKDDFYGLLAKEFGKMLSKVDITKEVAKFLESHRIHLEAKVSFEPKAQVADLKKEIT